MVKGFHLDAPGSFAFEDARQDLLTGLDQPFGPARLLSFEGRHFYGQFGGALDVLQILELPPFELCAIGKISVFSKCVVLPAATFLNGLTPPHSGGAVEVKEDTAAEASAVLKDEVAVEQNGFDFSEERIVA